MSPLVAKNRNDTLLALREAARALENAKTDEDVNQVLSIIASWDIRTASNPLIGVSEGLARSQHRLERVLKRESSGSGQHRLDPFNVGAQGRLEPPKGNGR